MVAGALAVIAVSLQAQDRAEGGTITGTIGTVYEDNVKPGDKALVRLTVPLFLGPPDRSSQLEIEPAVGWHRTGGVTDASGWSYTRLRAYHYFNAAGRVSVAPEIETFLKTESKPGILGYGFLRLMPGVTVRYRAAHQVIATVRGRWEFSEGESPGIKPLGRITIRPTLFFPPVGRWSFWSRGDIIFDQHGGGIQYNVESNATLRLTRKRRLALYAQPRIYLGAAARASNLWRLRSGVVWSLGDFHLRHDPHRGDFEAP